MKPLQRDIRPLRSHFLDEIRHSGDEAISVYLGGQTIMQARMNSPVMVIPEAMKALHALSASVEKAGVPKSTLGLVELRASQINGCSVCLDMHAPSEAGW
jgi:alkylhydroperoxidase family enzyme